MKVVDRWNFHGFLLLLVAAVTVSTSNAYLPAALQRQHRAWFASPPTQLYSSTSARSNDADFSAFAESLEVDDDDSNDELLSSDKNTRSSAATKEKPWQAKFEELLDPMTSVAQRQILLSELLNANEKIRESVLDALTNRKIDPLLTPTQRRLQEGTRAVVRQLANDILPQIQKSAEAVNPIGRQSSSRSISSPLPFAPPSPFDIESIGNRLFSAVSNQIEKNLKELQDDLTDPLTKIPQRLERQRTEVLQEARNVFLETPEGLQEPPYSVVESCDLYEIRDYDAYSVASTSVATASDTASMEGMAAGQAFNILASYLFGGNEEQKQMSMTTPVTTTSTGEMRFYLAPTAGGFPKPYANSNKAKDGAASSAGSSSSDMNKVDVMDIPPARLAVRKFTGFVTEGEVARQKDTLLQALEMDGVELDVPHGAIVPHIVFQYNPPYTLPIVRRNEIAVPVRKVDDALAPIISLKKEWNVDDDNEIADGDVNGQHDVAPSD